MVREAESGPLLAAVARERRREVAGLKPGVAEREVGGVDAEREVPAMHFGTGEGVLLFRETPDRGAGD